MAKTILLVEDEAALALMTKKWLLNEGFDVIHSMTGEDAVRIAMDHMQPIDLILMDIDLGSGIDGTQAAREILQIRSLPILFISSHTEKEIVQKTEEITSYGYLVKGSGNTALLASIKMAFKLFDAHKTITQREEALIQSEKKYRLLFENMTSGFAYFKVLYNKEGNPYELRLLEVNSVFEKLSGLDAGYLTNKTLADAKSNIEKNWLERYQQMTSSTQPYIIQEYSPKRDKYFEIMLFSPEKNYLAMIVNDITDRKRSEEEYTGKLITANSDKEKFISILAHDLIGPVAGFVNLSEELRYNSDQLEREEIEQMNIIMHKTAKNVQSLLLNLLDWSKLHLGSLVFSSCPFDLYSAINEVISIFSHSAQDKSVTILNHSVQGTIVNLDKYVISTVLRNLVSNSVKFSNAGGCVIISSEINNNLIEIKVSDNGVGINNNNLNKLFKIGSQLSTRGTNDEPGSGLGLVLCHDLIEKNGGRITVKSDPGILTVVTCSFPLIPD